MNQTNNDKAIRDMQRAANLYTLGVILKGIPALIVLCFIYKLFSS